MKTHVKLNIASTIEFRSKEDYGSLGITSNFEGHRLVALEVVIEHDREAGRDQIVSLGRDKVMPLLALVQYGSGKAIEISSDETRAIDPESSVAIGLGYVKLDAVLSRPLPLPPVTLVSSLSRELTQQLGWYRSAQNSSWVIEKIRNYFEVLELESHVATGLNKPYEPPKETKCLRDAVSHPRLRNTGVKRYLERHLRTDHIDPNNDRHLQFLESKVGVVQAEAERILQNRVPQWW